MSLNISEAIKYPISNKYFKGLVTALLLLTFIGYLMPKSANYVSSAFSVVAIFKTALSILIFRMYLHFDESESEDIQDNNMHKLYFGYVLKVFLCNLVWLLIFLFFVIILIIFGSHLIDTFHSLKLLLVLGFLAVFPFLFAINMGLFVSFAAETKFWNWFNFIRMFKVWKKFFLAIVVLVIINFVFLMLCILTKGVVSGIFAVLYAYYTFCEAAVLAQLYKQNPVFE